MKPRDATTVIGRLRLRVPAPDAASGRRFARAVAEGLAARSAELGSAPRAGVQVRLASGPAHESDALARRVVEQVLAAARGGRRQG